MPICSTGVYYLSHKIQLTITGSRPDSTCLVFGGGEELPVCKRLLQLLQATVVEVQDLVLALATGDHQLSARGALVGVEHSQRPHLTCHDTA